MSSTIAEESQDPQTEVTARKSREKSGRESLKSKEKSLRGRENVTLRELIALLEECEKELPEDDSILKRVRASVSTREAQVCEYVERKLSGKKNLTFKQLEEVKNMYDEELDLARSLESKELQNRLRKSIDSRRKSHRETLMKEVEAAKENQVPLKDLVKLKHKILLEVSDSDELVVKILQMEKQRESSHRTKLSARLSSILRDLKKYKTSQLQEFLKECQDELDDNDAILGQIRSALENKMMEDRGLKKVHNLDELEKGERGKSDDTPINRSKKSKNQPVDGETPKKKKSTPSQKSFTAWLKESSVVSTISEEFHGLRKDLSSAPPASAMYKLGLIIVMIMYAVIIGYSTSLSFKVAKFDFGPLPSLPFTRSIDSTSTSTGIQSSTPPPPPKQASSSAVSPADTKEENEQATSNEPDEDKDDDND